ncbi:MAG: hypothetical protein E6Q40_03850 [Cupriavidus sp.]|nr:MAG: hypothetical protein E6Q40_03850 [Cupriavidus sp.]
MLLADLDHSTEIGRRVALVTGALRSVRIRRAGLSEEDIHNELSRALVQARIPHKREHVFASGCRADLWIDGVVVEVKKGRPERAKLAEQVARYVSKDNVHAVIIVLERSIGFDDGAFGKPVTVVSLNQQWGISL